MIDDLIRPMSKRNYVLVPIDRIKVLNPRDRDMVKFQSNIRSIKTVGVIKPIMVSDRVFAKTGYYELVFGQGRYMAKKALGHSSIKAEVVSIDQKEAYRRSLIENIARIPPKTIWFAIEVKRMRDAGIKIAHICDIVGRSDTFVEGYIKLAEQGEERLINGVEKGLFPISFAIEVAKADDASVQNILIDAFDSGMISATNVQVVRKIIENRQIHGKNPSEKNRRQECPKYTVNQLKADITRITREKEAYVREATFKQRRLIVLVDGLNTLWRDEEFLALLKAKNLADRPKLEEIYNV
jgi:ParB family chromosome partitioning protein